MTAGRRPGLRRRGFGRRAPKPPENPESVEAAREKAIGLLARRDFGSRELKGRLEEAGYVAGAAATAVTELEDERLVDDARYVEGTVAARAARGQGPVRIALELRRQGLPAELVEAAVDAKSPDWTERAIELRRRRFGRGAPADAKERTRQVRFLLYRGFTGEHVRAAMGRAASDLTDDELEAGDLDALGDGGSASD